MNSKRTVLVVDDDLDACESARRMIERAGFGCVVATSGVDALCALQLHEVQVIVSDHDMPVMDGIELLQMVAIRHPAVCRILLTGREDLEPAKNAINLAHVYRYLRKPCRGSDLLTALHFALEASDGERENRRLNVLLRHHEALVAAVRRRVPELLDELEAKVAP